MVKVGRMFKKGAGEEGSAFLSKAVSIKKFGFKKSPSPTPEDVAPGAPDGEEAPGEYSHDKSVVGPDGNVYEEENSEEMRDETASPADDNGGRENAESSVASGSIDEASYEETVPSSQEEEGTVETYDDEEDISYVETAEEKSYVSSDPANRSIVSGKTEITAKGNDPTRKYFHKDVVLNSLEDGANSLVIRAMYFIPKPKHLDHVVVKVEASTISARDCMKCTGHGLTKSMLPFVPGFEVVGTVQTLGDKARAEGQFREGDRVAGYSNFGGGNSRFISIPANRLTKVSNDVKSTQAVCMIHDYMAAYKALRLAKKAGSPFTGMNILVTDGFSPVGQAVINLASMEGANIYCCADESRHSYLASLGVKCFPKNPEKWLKTAAGTFDVVIDNSCIDAYTSSWYALNQKGSLVCVGPVFNIEGEELPGASCGVFDIVELRQKMAALKAKYIMSQTSFLDTTACYDQETEQYKQDLRYLMFMLERGGIKPKVAERVSLDDVPDAQRLMRSGRANGTVVCVPWIEG
mmetsp:Transcript_17270/g.36434  ORF Transcript_17270/g.36434 Transcript_17270/m.36434 type:complete len:522 (+) Transcript_17270:77-1642(+)